MSELIEPINPGRDSPLIMEGLNFTEDASSVYVAAYTTEENDLVTMLWSNATLTIRAGTLRAWIELGIVTAP